MCMGERLLEEGKKVSEGGTYVHVSCGVCMCMGERLLEEGTKVSEGGTGAMAACVRACVRMRACACACSAVLPGAPPSRSLPPL